MKKVRILNIIAYILLAFCIAIFVLSFIYEINKYIIYGSFFIAGIDLAALIIQYNYNKLRRHIDWLEERVRLSNSISYRVKLAGEKSFYDMPLGIIVYSNDYTIEWANEYARKISQSPLINRKIANINMELDVGMRSQENFDIELYGKQYNVQVIKDDNIMYLTDKTEFKNLEKKYQDRTQATGILNLDNFDEALASVDAQDKAIMVSEMIGILSDWAEKYDIYIRGYSEKQYIFLMNRSQLEEIIEEQFSVIDDINDYCKKEDLRITVSIGVACSDIPYVDLMDKSNELLELALNRGGNQAVVSLDDNITYYGGKEKGAETRAPVFVRVKTQELCDLISSCDHVVIMAHSNMDADGFGASIAMLKIVNSLKKEGYIVFDESLADITVHEVYRDIASEHVGLLNYLVTPEEGLKKIDSKTLLIIVDVQYESLLLDSRLYHKAKKNAKIAIVDHHRSNDQAITDYSYLYNKTTSSSSVELIVEMFDYLEDEVTMTTIEASLMLLGIVTDTSNLMYRTSSQTFSVLSKLQMYGAEMTKVQRYLREDFDMYVKRMTILNNVEMVDGQYGIALCGSDDIVTRQFIAKVADSLILVESIKAGFCIGRINDRQVAISARSLDEVNVQIIMERLGGGGHFNNSATQIEGITINEAKERLINVLKVQDQTGEKIMKVILMKDVRGKGKANDIIELPSGYANYLIRQKQAVLATPDNLNEVQRKMELEKIAQQEELEKMKELKEFLDKQTITIAVRVGVEGKLFGSVSTKQIADEIKNQFDITIDKRIILPDSDKENKDKSINKLGTYDIPIQLHKEVRATIKLHVVEKQ